MDMKEILSIYLLILMFNLSLTVITISPYGGSYEMSTYGSPFRIVSHPNFNRRTKYGNNKHISWNFKLGENCCEIKIFCPFMRTNSNSRCSKGDLLLIRSTGRNSKFCRFKKPGKDKPLTLLGDAKIIWKTDRRGKERGFECLIR